MKVTKAKGLNTSPFGCHASATRERQWLWHKNSRRGPDLLVVLVAEPLKATFSRSEPAKWLVFGPSFWVTFFWASRKK
jgi:hypothetical protein